MACKTIGRFVYDNTTVAVAENANVPIPVKTVSNKCIDCDGQVITITAPGVFMVNANFTFVATATGAIETQLYRNGNAIPGAHALSTAAAVGDNCPQAICAVITVSASSPNVSLAFKASDDTSVSIANVIVTKVA